MVGHMSSGFGLIQDLPQVTNSLMPVDNAHWYAVRTRSRHEKVAAKQLQGLDVETFLPLIRENHRWSNGQKQVEMPLFPGYAFVRIVYSLEERLRIIRARGVVGFVGTQGHGTPVPDWQINNVKTVLTHKLRLKDHSFLQVGQKVRLRGGSLDGVEGILVTRKRDRVLVISVGPIQRSVSINVERYDVEAV